MEKAAAVWPMASAGCTKPKEAANAAQPRLAWGSSEHLPLTAEECGRRGAGCHCSLEASAGLGVS